jgi:hypothetical protein
VKISAKKKKLGIVSTPERVKHLNKHNWHHFESNGEGRIGSHSAEAGVINIQTRMNVFETRTGPQE